MVVKYFDKLAAAFEQHADPAIAAGAKAYMRNISDFYGLPSPLRRKLVQTFLKQEGYPTHENLETLVYFAWEQPQREWQYTALDIAGRMVKNAGPGMLDLAEWMIIHKSWWDSVDFIAPNIAGALFKKYPDTRMEYVEKWMASGNLWLQRSCLLHQLKYGKTTNQALLFDLCRRLSGHPDFFIRKAIGWSLRQYSKTAPAAVIEFVKAHELSNLSSKEALKVINRQNSF
jgi:3-methyladenine DNA glycosylase AlkD